MRVDLTDKEASAIRHALKLDLCGTSDEEPPRTCAVSRSALRKLMGDKDPALASRAECLALGLPLPPREPFRFPERS